MNMIARASTSAADLELVNAGLEHARLAAEIDGMADRLSAMHDAWEKTREPIPAALRYTDADAAMGLPAPRDRQPEYPGYYSGMDIDHLKSHRFDGDAAIPAYPENHPKFLQPIPEGEPIGEFITGHVLIIRGRKPAAPAIVARVDEIEAAWYAWRSADHERLAATGYDAADKEREALYDRMEEFERLMVHTAAATTAGVMAKVRAAMWCADANGAPHALEFDSYESTEAILAESVVRDLAALIERSATEPVASINPTATGPVSQLSAEYFAVREAIDQCEGNDEAADRLWDRVSEIDRALIECRPANPAECAALVQAALSDYRQFHGTSDDDRGFGGFADAGEQIVCRALEHSLRVLRAVTAA